MKNIVGFLIVFPLYSAQQFTLNPREDPKEWLKLALINAYIQKQEKKRVELLMKMRPCTCEECVNVRYQNALRLKDEG